MAKKSIDEQFRDFVKASTAESNKPMTRSEIATASAKKKSKAKRTAKKTAKKAAPKKTAKNAAKKTAKKAKTQEGLEEII
jgi:hypothetical protein